MLHPPLPGPGTPGAIGGYCETVSRRSVSEGMLDGTRGAESTLVSHPPFQGVTIAYNMIVRVTKSEMNTNIILYGTDSIEAL